MSIPISGGAGYSGGSIMVMHNRIAAPLTVATLRLRLRPFILADAAEVQRLAGDRVVADTTLLIPHPYPDGLAEAWIRTHAPAFAAGEQATFAITRREDDALVGAVGLTIAKRHDRAELGYWIGAPYWNQGFATEAARAVLGVGFAKLGLNRIEAHHFTRNPASGRVMQKAGMRQEALVRQYVRKGDGYEDVRIYVALNGEWDQRLSSGRRPALFSAGILFLSLLVGRAVVRTMQPDGNLGGS